MIAKLKDRLVPIRNKLSAAIFPVLLIVTGCGPTESRSDLMSGAVPVGQYRGYESMSSFLQQKLLDPDFPENDNFELGVFLGTRDPASLPALLGTFSGDGPDNSYRNGVPNPMNTAVWYLVMQRISKSVAAYCTDPTGLLYGRFKISDDLKAHLETLCLWPATPAGDLRSFWNYLSGAGAPEIERETWLAFLEQFRQPVSNDHPGKWITKTAMETITLNPWFLLKQ